MSNEPSSCALCTFQKDCGQNQGIGLYATTPILRDLLASALASAGFIHATAHGILLLDPSVTDNSFAKFARQNLSERETEDIRISRARSGDVMNASTLTQWLRRTDTGWFDRALEENQFTTYFQPIVDVSEGRIHGHECLVRLFTDRAYNGGEIMEAAMERGHTHAFDSYMRQLSVRAAAAQHTPGTLVFINFMPSSIYDPEYCMKSTFAAMAGTRLQPADIVFEVVESEQVHDPRHLKKICNYYRKHGFGFALDDVGTGSNSLQMVCDLIPDYIKIDKSLVFGLKDPMYRSTVGKIAELAREFNVRVIAEGIEDQETAATCRQLGIGLMQGYYFSRPAAEMIACPADLANLAKYVVYQDQPVPSPEITLAQP